MKPHLFVPSILALTAALAALIFAFVVTAGFASEGCRFGTGEGLRWGSAGEFLLAQALLFGLPGALLIALLYRAFALRFADNGATMAAPKAMAWCFGLAFAAATLSSLHFLLTCGARVGPLSSVAPLAIGLRFAAPISAMFGVIALGVAVVQGVSSASRPR